MHFLRRRNARKIVREEGITDVDDVSFHNDRDGLDTVEQPVTGETVDDGEESAASSTPSAFDRYIKGQSALIAAFVVLLGVVAGSLILGFGVSAASREKADLFTRFSMDLTQQFGIAWEEYTMAALWIQQSSRAGKQTQGEFRELYCNLRSSGLDFEAVASVPNVTHAQRPAFENETRSYLEEQHPGFPHLGFTTLVNGTLLPRAEEPHPFYFPAHFVEPIEQSRELVDLDFFETPGLRYALERAVDTYAPVLTEQIRLVADSIVLFHPGIPPEDGDSASSRPVQLSMLAVRVPQLLSLVATHIGISEEVSVYLYDSTDHHNNEADFLGGATFHENDNFPTNAHPHVQVKHFQNGRISTPVNQLMGRNEPPKSPVTFVEELSLEEARKSPYLWYEGQLSIASRDWTIVVVAEDDTYKPRIGFIILSSALIVVACFTLALWIFASYRRQVKINKLKSAAERDKASIVLETARKATKTERELNDFIAHEVRNPLSAAISATSFVSSVVNEKDPLTTAESRKSAQEDVHIIESSLQFINDLLRNMLDMHRAFSKQLRIEKVHVDLLRDVLEPVASMLYNRGDDYKVVLDCPENILVLTDGLRLKQIILNLGRNAAKFVQKGFVRLRAAVVDGLIEVSIEDSGPGIPLEKRQRLFLKFQESLDTLSQGTGIGLCLCRSLIDLLGGDIVLDEDYDSGVEGYPGARFVIQLKTGPVDIESVDLETGELKSSTDGVPTKRLSFSEVEGLAGEDSDISTSRHGIPTIVELPVQNLPDKLSVLFVDDDTMLRKLFSRSIRRAQPDWEIQEAANGETSLRLVEDNDFDLIFMDQYMASVDKQLLGTETVRALRAKGIKARICGLSANDMEKPFLRNGANAFLIKPFPCEKEALKIALRRILYEDMPTPEPSSN